jgi:adenosylcobinamide-GDP ribazoletransferase
MRDALALLTTVGRRGGALTARSLGWFPIVGALLGAGLGAGWWAADRAFAPLLAAALVMVADLALTGLLHFDGLVDTADGLMPHLTREERLRVMRRPDAGAFGVTVAATVLLLRVAALSSLDVSAGLLVALWCSSRALVASVPAFVPYARANGMATALLAGAPRWPALVVVPAAALAVVANGAGGLAAVLALTVAALALVLVAHRRLGGFTGDVLGAAIVAGETVGLVLAAARW